MRNLTQDNITQAVIARLAQTPDARLREIMTSLVQHLHAFARDVKLSEQEWVQGIRFLAEAGRNSDGERPDLVLLSDRLGLSLLTVAMNSDTAAARTERPDSAPGLVRGRVVGAGGEPVAGAVVQVAAAGAVRAGPDGRFQFRQEPDGGGVVPEAGPVGEMLRATTGHDWRPEHLRFTVEAGGYEPLVSDVFRSGDEANVEYHFLLNPTTKANP